MSSSAASSWVKFFTNAGIPSPTNATYAHVFVENRIQMDMLSEINKEHLKEMGITPMGDIISILRHSKAVNDESVRSRILKSNIEIIPLKSVATIRPASPITSTTLSSVAIAPARRVLPEQEGKYKVSLPKGTTAKSREMLAKHSACKKSSVSHKNITNNRYRSVQMDKFEKKSVFDRLKPATDVEMADSTSSDSIVRLGKVSPSIFNRLGAYAEVERKIERQSISFSGILKNSPIKQAPKGVVKKRVNQRVIMNKQPPARVVMDTESESDHSDEKMDSDDFNKQVKFSSKVEVLEIEPRRLVKSSKNNIKGLRTDGIKDRLEDIKIKRSYDTSSNSNNYLHNIKKTITMKPSKGSPVKNSRMIADQSPVTIKSRLDVKRLRPGHPSSSGSSTSNIHKRLNKNNEGRMKGGVFNRLGKK